MAAGDVDVAISTPIAKLSALFDGVDDFIQIPADARMLGPNLNGFTISAWVFLKTKGETAGNIFDLSTSTSATDGVSMFASATNNQLAVRINGGTSKYSLANSVPYFTWVHDIFTCTAAGDGQHYINGVASANLSSLVTLPSAIISTSDPRIGNRCGQTDRTTDGAIKHLKFWNRVLTAEEIAKVYGNEPVDKGLILDYPLESDYVNKQNGVTATNSGSTFAIVEQTVGADVRTARTTANDKWIAVNIANKQVMTMNIEAAP